MVEADLGLVNEPVPQVMNRGFLTRTEGLEATKRLMILNNSPLSDPMRPSLSLPETLVSALGSYTASWTSSAQIRRMIVVGCMRGCLG